VEHLSVAGRVRAVVAPVIRLHPAQEVTPCAGELGFGVQGLGFGVWGLGISVDGSGWGRGFEVEGAGHGLRLCAVRQRAALECKGCL